MSEQQIYRLVAYVVGFVTAWAEFGLSAVSWVIVFIAGAIGVAASRKLLMEAWE